ncbi:hemin uptake protein HemP [Citrobacter sp. R56]|nr:hemin uptake protein HemP [Citrobacter sp. R56]
MQNLIFMIIILVIIFITDVPGMLNTTAAQHIKDTTPLSPSRAKRQIDSKMLLGEEGWVLIEHKGQHYLLRQTQSGKLILTK